ncbi:cytochrome c1 [Cobetia sp. L2A1]|uniref:cytochrome c1 n=1 Tax=Cobetia sp. L2A1 TaxID=2686360 RepID=UPI00131E76E0
MIKYLATYLLAAISLFSPGLVMAAGDDVHLDVMQPDLRDQPSLQRGMQLYANYCLGCHSLQYQRYSRAAEDLGMPVDLVEKFLIFSPELKINDTMRIGMSATDATDWFGAPPPDLSLEARLRGTDWIYTYLRSFYRDESRPWGVNNTVFPQVGMPHVLEPLQGVQEKVCTQSDIALSGAALDLETGRYQSCDVLEITQSGSMTTQEFDQAMWDLTNFLSYVGEPSRLKAENMAPKVLIFILIFTLLAYLLKKEYWRDIH